MLTMAPRQAAMTAATFKAILARKKLSYAQAAEKLETTRRTVIRWAQGHSPISVGNAALIKIRLK